MISGIVLPGFIFLKPFTPLLLPYNPVAIMLRQGTQIAAFTNAFSKRIDCAANRSMLGEISGTVEPKQPSELRSRSSAVNSNILRGLFSLIIFSSLNECFTPKCRGEKLKNN